MSARWQPHEDLVLMRHLKETRTHAALLAASAELPGRLIQAILSRTSRLLGSKTLKKPRGKRWSYKEYQEFSRLVALKMPTAEIGLRLGRTEAAIQQRKQMPWKGGNSKKVRGVEASRDQASKIMLAKIDEAGPDRVALARYLRKHGPTDPVDLVFACHCDYFSDVLRHEWFEIEAGKVSLTPAAYGALESMNGNVRDDERGSSAREKNGHQRRQGEWVGSGRCGTKKA